MGGLKEASVLWGGPGLLSPSRRRNREWQCRTRETREEESFRSRAFKGTGKTPLSGGPLGLPLAWVQRDQAEEREWHEEGWGRDVT